MRDSGGAVVTALVDSDGGVPSPGERHADDNDGGTTSAARYADHEDGSAASRQTA
jgi:hypothetical protein